MNEKLRYEKMDVVDGLCMQLVQEIAEQGGFTQEIDHDIEIVAELRGQIIEYLLEKGLVTDYHAVYPCCEE